MPLELDPLTSLTRGRFTYFPVVPGRSEFAALVREQILKLNPRVVAVELPRAIEGATMRAIKRLPEMSVVMFPEPLTNALDEDSMIYIPIEPADPFVEALRTSLAIGSEVLFVEPSLGQRPHVADTYPDPYAMHAIGHGNYVQQWRLNRVDRSPEMEKHAAGMAYRLQGTDPSATVLVVVSLNLLDALLDAMEKPQEEPPTEAIKQSDIELFNLHPECLAEITTDYPFHQARYEAWRLGGQENNYIDRRQVNFALLKEAELFYEANTGDKVASWHRRLLSRFTRNLAQMEHQLVSGLFDLTSAARSIVDDNYAWEVWELANRYEYQRDQCPGMETIRISAEEIYLHTRKIKLRRRLPRPKQKLKPASLKSRRKEKHKGEWTSQLDGASICSFPPEDLVIEDYGRFLKQKAKSLLSEDRSRTEKFTTSILDGVDIRETIRNWHEGKIYVREQSRVAGDVGAVVVIFDEDKEDRYTYLTTWLGENQNESDMAFYSTHPFEKVIGPGIGRAEYGGYLMTLPARRMFDVWSDPDYDFAESKPERLLMAALDYSVERHVVYVADKPPRTIFQSIAGKLGRQIIYIPVGQLSPAKLKKVRVVHILDSHERRNEAKGYLW